MLNVELLYPEQIRPIKRTEYDRMVMEGLFADERIELIRGTLVAMTPQGARHAELVSRLSERFVYLTAGRARVRIQSPLAIGEHSEPEPDLAVVPIQDYSTAHPEQALLVIEVADTSLDKDREIKAGIYAAGNVPEYWIINLIDRVVEVYRDPRGGRYTSYSSHQPTETIALLSLPDAKIDLTEIL